MIDDDLRSMSAEQLRAEYIRQRKLEREHAEAYGVLCKRRLWQLRPGVRRKVDDHVSMANRAQYEGNRLMRALRDLGEEVPLESEF